MLQGSCLCRAVAFEVSGAPNSFELCHCNRCRKATGSAFIPALRVRREQVKFLQGEDMISTYDAPILYAEPAYRSCFCKRCGSPVPDPSYRTAEVEVPAGVLDTECPFRPERHIFVEYRVPWFNITDGLPQFDKAALAALRRARHDV